MQINFMSVFIILAIFGCFSSTTEGAAADAGHQNIPPKIYIKIDIYALDGEPLNGNYSDILQNQKPENSPSLIVTAGEPGAIRIGNKVLNGKAINMTNIKFTSNITATNFDLDFELVEGEISKIGSAKSMEVGSPFLMTLSLNNITKLVSVNTGIQKNVNTRELDNINAITIRSGFYTYPYLIIENLPECNTEVCQHLFSSYKQHHNILAKLRLANLYMAGYGIEKNDERAFKIYRTYARKGDAFSEYMFARLSIKLGRSTAHGVKYLHRSADRGYIDAMLLLSEWYLEGKYIEKDKALSDKWITKAANTKSDRLKGKVSTEVSNTGKPQSSQLADIYEGNVLYKKLKNSDKKQIERFSFEEYFQLELETIENPKKHRRLFNHFIGAAKSLSR